MLNVVRIWILLSTLLVGSGWILSALHQLNRAGYGAVFALAGIAVVCWQRKTKWRPQKNPATLIHNFRRRFQRPVPLLFLALAGLSLTAGFLYLPSNADSTAYRIPRVLHWLGAGQWHWIHSLDIRMNIAGCGFEWLTTPLTLFTHSYRFGFLINWISFLLLPGLIFSVFTRLQVRPRVAWWWMWLLASGWCYVMQAASDINDSFAAVYALAAVDFALRARERKSLVDLWFSILAAALLTGAKQTALPLVLVCAVAIFPAMRLLLRRPVASMAIVGCCVLASFAPLAFFNHKLTGTWTGIPVNSGPEAMFWARCQPDSLWWGILGNAFCLPLQNLQPPFLPGAETWNGMMRRFLETPFGSNFISFENFGYLRRAITAETAGIGLGVVLLTLLSILVAGSHRETVRPGSSAKADLIPRLLCWMPYLALLVFMAKVGSYQNARQLAPYYVFFFPLLLASSAHSSLVRRRWWQWLGLASMLVTLAMLVMARNQPLFPAQTIIAVLRTAHPQSTFLSKVSDSFAFGSSMRKVTSNPFSNGIPRDEQVIGYATLVGFSEPGLWMPLGSRRVERVLPTDSVGDLRGKNIRFVIIGSEFFEVAADKTIEAWLNRYDGEMVNQSAYEYGPGGHLRWLYLVRLR